MLITKDQGLELSRAAARTRRLAAVPETPVAPGDITTLEGSPWLNHQVDAGWLCLYLFAQQLEIKRRKTNLLGRARNIWTSVVTHPRVDSQTRIHAGFAKTHSGLWVSAIEHKTEWPDRARVSHKAGILSIKQVIADSLSKCRGDYELSDITGATAEVIVAHALNEHAIDTGRAAVTVPAESWNDTSHVRKGANFDLWQIQGGKKRKIQVKTTRHKRSHVAPVQYDDDIAVVYLDQHWLGESPGRIPDEYIKTDPSDSDFIGVGSSIQCSIDRHFATK